MFESHPQNVQEHFCGISADFQNYWKYVDLTHLSINAIKIPETLQILTENHARLIARLQTLISYHCSLLANLGFDS